MPIHGLDAQREPRRSLPVAAAACESQRLAPLGRLAASPIGFRLNRAGRARNLGRPAPDGGAEESLWNSIRSAEENVMPMRRLAENLGSRENGANAEALLQRARETQRGADLVRQEP